MASSVDPICEGAAEDDDGRCRGSDGRFVERRCCEPNSDLASPELNATDESFSCTVLAYDESSVFDSSIGSPYVYTMDGEILTEPGHWEVRLRTRSSSERPDGLAFGFGGLSIAGPDDAIDFVGNEEIETNGVNRTVKTWRFSRADSDEAIEVAIFTDSGMGLLGHSLDDEAAAQLDCRADYSVPDEL